MMHPTPVGWRLPFLALIILCWFLTSLQAASTLNFPRLSFDQDTFLGVAIVNPSDQDAVVTMTAYGENGQPVTGIDNPVQKTVPANQQLVGLTSSFFGTEADPSTIAWFQAISPIDGLTGFFLFVNGSITQFDGADLPVSAKSIVFNEVRVGAGSTTELNIINPFSGPASLDFQLLGSDSSPISKFSLFPPKE
ncbi:hypothetical protein MYX82_00600 [Acidobacteria bacterium AH-259-D05]|nr:hypothetical protein [Acidobacteria bacterium AH-259-D05]